MHNLPPSLTSGSTAPVSPPPRPQVADELLRKASGGGSFWHNPFAKEEERQLVRLGLLHSSMPVSFARVPTSTAQLARPDNPPSYPPLVPWCRCLCSRR